MLDASTGEGGAEGEWKCAGLVMYPVLLMGVTIEPTEAVERQEEGCWSEEVIMWMIAVFRKTTRTRDIEKRGTIALACDANREQSRSRRRNAYHRCRRSSTKRKRIAVLPSASTSRCSHCVRASMMFISVLHALFVKIGRVDERCGDEGSDSGETRLFGQCISIREMRSIDG